MHLSDRYIHVSTRKLRLCVGNLSVDKGKIPCQAICNNMYVDKIPPELPSLEKLEQILIEQQIVFEKIIIMPKGQQKKSREQSVIYLLNVMKHVRFYLGHQKDQV